MATQRWVIESATGEFLYGGFYDPTPPRIGVDAEGEPINDPAFSIVEVPGESLPDPRTERYDAAVPTRRRPATASELTTYDTKTRTVRFQRTSDDKDLLATIALIARARVGVAAWNGLTLAQKRDTIRNEAAVWRTNREFIEQNL